MSQVQIVGSDIICSAGLDKFEVFRNCLNKKSFVNSEGLAPLSDSQWEYLQKKVPQEFRHSKCTILSYQTFTQALAEAKWQVSDLKNAGFIFASTTSQVDQWENDLPDYKNPNVDLSKIESAVFNQSLGSPLKTLSESFQIQGPCAVVASSCSAGLQAISIAHRWIQNGLVDRCIVGSTEILSNLTTLGFNSLRLVTKNPSQPFTAQRNGINLGEGSGFLLLEKANLQKEGWGFVTGTSFNLDAYHATSPDPEGKGSLRALTSALLESGRSLQDLDWVYTHGTGSPANDASEAKAIHALFAQQNPPPITSTKPIHGHTLAASGVIESIIGLVAMKENQILPTYSQNEVDPQIQLTLLQKSETKVIRNFVKNSLGFGGVNASVLFSSSQDLK